MQEILNQFLPMIFTIISSLAILVSIITQLIKDLKLFKKIPTNIVVLVLSITLSILSYIIYSNIIGCTIYWYGIVGSFFGGFVVDYVATYGWDKFNNLMLRYKNKNKINVNSNNNDDQNKIILK